jgi:hypothetical protein
MTAALSKVQSFRILIAPGIFPCFANAWTRRGECAIIAATSATVILLWIFSGNLSSFMDCLFTHQPGRDGLTQRRHRLGLLRVHHPDVAL